jgi:hypothetical protein
MLEAADRNSIRNKLNAKERDIEDGTGPFLFIYEPG